MDVLLFIGGVSGVGLPYIKIVSYGGVIGSREGRGGEGVMVSDGVKGRGLVKCGPGPWFGCRVEN